MDENDCYAFTHETIGLERYETSAGTHLVMSCNEQHEGLRAESAGFPRTSHGASVHASLVQNAKLMNCKWTVTVNDFLITCKWIVILFTSY